MYMKRKLIRSLIREMIKDENSFMFNSNKMLTWRDYPGIHVQTNINPESGQFTVTITNQHTSEEIVRTLPNETEANFFAAQQAEKFYKEALRNGQIKSVSPAFNSPGKGVEGRD